MAERPLLVLANPNEAAKAKKGGVEVAHPHALRKSNSNALGHESINWLMHWRTSAFAFRARPQVCSLRKFWCWKQPGQ